MKTLTEQYRLIKEDKGHKGVFLKEAKAKYPNLLTNSSTFKEATTILKQKNIISENYVDLQPINNPLERKKEGYENAFANFLAEAEAKAEEKKVSKEVEEDAEKNYDYKDKKDPNNMIFGQIQMGYYFEMKQEKNADKTIDEIKDIVFKNLAKDPIYYTKNGQFGVEVGYTDDNVALGEPVEAKGEYKSSGYGKLKENKILKEEKYSGAIIRKGTSDKAKEDTKIVRQALKKAGIKFTNRGEFGMDFKDADLAQIKKVIAGAKVGEFIISHDEDKSKEPKGEYKSSGYGNLKESKILKEALNKDLKDVGMDIAKYLKEKGLEPKFIQGENPKLYQDFPENGSLLSLMDGGARLEIAVNDSKIDTLKEIIKKYNLQSLQVLKQTGGWADDPKKKAQSKGEIYILSDKPQRKGKAFTLELRRFDPSTIKESKKPVNEIAIAGGLVTGGGFTSKDYKSFFGLEEEQKPIIPTEEDEKRVNRVVDKMKELVGEDEIKENFENEMADALATQAEEILRDAEARGEDLNIDKVLDMVMGDMRGLLKHHLEIFVNDLM